VEFRPKGIAETARTYAVTSWTYKRPERSKPFDPAVMPPEEAEFGEFPPPEAMPVVSLAVALSGEGNSARTSARASSRRVLVSIACEAHWDHVGVAQRYHYRT
jgi:hypothetical protein